MSGLMLSMRDALVLEKDRIEFVPLLSLFCPSDQNGPENPKTTQNRPTRPSTIQNSPKQAQTAQEMDPKRSRTAQNAPNSPKTSQNSPKKRKTLQNSPKTAQNNPNQPRYSTNQLRDSAKDPEQRKEREKWSPRPPEAKISKNSSFVRGLNKKSKI